MDKTSDFINHLQNIFIPAVILFLVNALPLKITVVGNNLCLILKYQHSFNVNGLFLHAVLLLISFRKTCKACVPFRASSMISLISQCKWTGMIYNCWSRIVCAEQYPGPSWQVLKWTVMLRRISSFVNRCSITHVQGVSEQIKRIWAKPTTKQLLSQ